LPVVDDDVAGDERELLVCGGVIEDVDGRGGNLPLGRAFVACAAGGATGFVTVRWTFLVCGTLTGMPFGPPSELKNDIFCCL